MRVPRRFFTPEMQSMQNQFFGHRDTVSRLPDKLDFTCDILEKKNEFLISADLPGLSKDMVSLTVDDDRRMHVTAERASRHEEVRNEEVENKGTFLVYELHPEVPETLVRTDFYDYYHHHHHSPFGLLNP